MSRAALLPSVADPYILLHTVYYFNRVWRDEVDKLYISVNSDVEPELVHDIMEHFKDDPKIEAFHTHVPLCHGDAISTLLERCEEDLIVLIEDDSIVFKKGFIDQCFRYLESDQFDLVGSPRMSCHPWIAEVARQQYSLDYSGWGDNGPAFWPCFFFINKAHLLQTDLNFADKSFAPGDVFLGQEVTEPMAGDTMVWTSLQLREMGLRILEIPQYHCYPGDKDSVGSGLGIFDGKCTHMHFGSLSSGIVNSLYDRHRKPLKERTKPVPPQVDTWTPLLHGTAAEMERRAMWWGMAFRVGNPIFKSSTQFGEAYRHGINFFIASAGLDIAEITAWESLYFGVIGHV